MNALRTISPDRRLFVLVLAWWGLGIASVPLIALRGTLPWLGALLCAAAIADLALLARERRTELTRVVPERGAREREAAIELRVRNPSARAVELALREAVPRDLVTPEPAWPALRLAPGEERILRYDIRPRVRGRRVWGPAVALVGSPFGLWRRRVELSEPSEILVQPESERYLRPEALDPKRVLASLGVRPKRQRGDGLDFDSLRDYVVGDEPRRIDWRATARRGRPIVRTHRHEESRTVLIALDASRLMGTQAPAGSSAEGAATPDFAASKLDHAIDAGLALAFASLVAGDRVGLLVFDRSVRGHLAPQTDRASLGLFVEALSDVQSSTTEADYRRVTRELITLQRKRAMVIFLTDFMEVDRAELVEPMALLARRHEVVFVALREPILEELEEDASRPRRGARSGTAEAERDRLALYRRLVLSDLLREREGRLVHLRRQGVSVLDVPPSEATAATLNRFMELRYGAG